MRTWRTAVIFWLALASPSGAGQDSLGQAAHDWNQKGIDLLEKGEFDAAISAFHQALQLKREDPVIPKNLAVAYSRQGQAYLEGKLYENAVVSFRNAAQFDSQTGRFPLLAGYAFAQAGRTKEAAQEWSRVLHDFPQEVDVYPLLARLHFDQGGCEEAVRVAEKGIPVLSKEPKDAPPKERDERKKRLKELQTLLEKAKADLQSGGCQNRFQSNHFDFHYDTERMDLVRNDSTIAQVLEDAYARVGERFSTFPGKRFQVILYDPKVFSETTRADEWVGGVFDGKIRVPVRDYAKEQAQVRKVLFHEYTHALVFTITSSCPVWLNEGLAQIEEGLTAAEAQKRLRTAQDRWLGPAELRGSFLGLGNERARIAYDMSLCLTRALLDEQEYYGVFKYLRRLGEGRDPEETVFRETFGKSFAEFVDSWKERL